MLNNSLRSVLSLIEEQEKETPIQEVSNEGFGNDTPIVLDGDIEVGNESIQAPVKITSPGSNDDTPEACNDQHGQCKDKVPLKVHVELNQNNGKDFILWILDDIWQEKHVKMLNSIVEPLTELDTIRVMNGTWYLEEGLSWVQHCKANVTIKNPMMTCYDVIIAMLYANDCSCGDCAFIELRSQRAGGYGTKVDRKDRAEVTEFRNNLKYAKLVYAGIITIEDIKRMELENGVWTLTGAEMQKRLDIGRSKMSEPHTEEIMNLVDDIGRINLEN